MNLALTDLVALFVWLLFLPVLKRVLERRTDLGLNDIAFLSVALLVVLGLVWLRIGYPAP